MYSSDDLKKAYLAGYLEGRNNPLLDKHKKKLIIENVTKLLKSGCNIRAVRIINENIEDPDSLFEPREEYSEHN